MRRSLSASLVMRAHLGVWEVYFGCPVGWKDNREECNVIGMRSGNTPEGSLAAPGLRAHMLGDRAGNRCITGLLTTRLHDAARSARMPRAGLRASYHGSMNNFRLYSKLKSPVVDAEWVTGPSEHLKNSVYSRQELGAINLAVLNSRDWTFTVCDRSDVENACI